MKIYSVLILLVLFSALVVAEPLITVMEEGEEKNINLGGKNYYTEVMIIEDVTPATATFNINGEITNQLVAKAKQTLKDGVIIEVIKIKLNEAGEAGLGDVVWFSLSNFCGDGICNEITEEHCGSCPVDCGCESGYYCMAERWCEEIRCGDHVCSRGEECAKDNCCNGKELDLQTDDYNCGTCFNRCGYKEKCVDGVCLKPGEEKPKEDESFCGDKICDKKEDCGSCKTDCGCKIGYHCEENSCIEDDYCSSDEECDDENPCTIDTCKGKPKNCVNEAEDGCVFDDLCYKQKEVVVNNGVPLFCDLSNEWKAQKEEGESCRENFECLSGVCKEGACFVERTFVEKVFWFFGIKI